LPFSYGSLRQRCRRTDRSPKPMDVGSCTLVVQVARAVLVPQGGVGKIDDPHRHLHSEVVDDVGVPGTRLADPVYRIGGPSTPDRSSSVGPQDQNTDYDRHVGLRASSTRRWRGRRLRLSRNCRRTRHRSLSPSPSGSLVFPGLPRHRCQTQPTAAHGRQA
jgi:hypothetical protein